MHATLPLAPPAASRHRLGVLLAVAAIYAFLFKQLWVEWYANPQYGYGWFVPLLAAYFFFLRWQDRPPAEPPASLRAAGAVAVVVALGIFPLRILHEANRDWAMTAWFLGLGITALVLCGVYAAGGWPWLRHFGIPIVFVLTAVEWPARINNGLTALLMGNNTGLACEIVRMVGIPAVQKGNLIQISTGTVGVEEACSGIRSLQTAVMAALALGELQRLGWMRRALLLAAGLAIAYVLNVGRTTFLTWIGATQGYAAIDKVHDTAGIVVLVAALGALFVLAQWMGRRKQGEIAPPRETPPDAPAPHRLLLRWIYGAAGWLLLCEIGNAAWYQWHERRGMDDPHWVLAWPIPGIANFRETPIAPVTQGLLRYTEGHSASWPSANGSQCHMFYFKWTPQRSADQPDPGHRPEICLQNAGMRLQEFRGTRMVEINGFHLPIREYLFDLDGQAFRVYYLLQRRGEKDQVFRTIQDMHDGNASDRVQNAILGRRFAGQQVIEYVVRTASPKSDPWPEFVKTLQRALQAETPGTATHPSP